VHLAVRHALSTNWVSATVTQRPRGGLGLRVDVRQPVLQHIRIREAVMVIVGVGTVGQVDAVPARRQIAVVLSGIGVAEEALVPFGQRLLGAHAQ